MRTETLTLEPETVVVYTPQHRPILCPLVKLTKYLARVRLADLPGGPDCVFSLETKKPARKRSSGPEFKGFYLKQSEVDRLKMLFQAGVEPGACRSDVTAEITAELLERCPVKGWWKAFPQTYICSGAGRIDVAFLQTGRLREGESQHASLAIEVKSDVADYRSDQKWSAYCGHFHGFAFAAPEGVVPLADLPGVVGLYAWDGLRLKCIREPVFRPRLRWEVYADTLKGMALAGARVDGEGASEARGGLSLADGAAGGLSRAEG